jgi:hypothetical protein
MLKWRDLCIHPKSPTKIFNHLKLRYLKETRLLYMKSINHHSIKRLLGAFQVRRAHSQAVVHKGTRTELLGLKCALHLPTHQKVLCINKNIIASFQSPKPKYSIPPNLDILRKIKFWNLNQSLRTEDWKTLCAFWSRRGRSWAIIDNGLCCSLTRIDCFKGIFFFKIKKFKFGGIHALPSSTIAMPGSCWTSNNFWKRLFYFILYLF